jgi:hypothetical protein
MAGEQTPCELKENPLSNDYDYEEKSGMFVCKYKRAKVNYDIESKSTFILNALSQRNAHGTLDLSNVKSFLSTYFNDLELEFSFDLIQELDMKVRIEQNKKAEQKSKNQANK